MTIIEQRPSDDRSERDQHNPKFAAVTPTHVAIIMDGNRRWARQHHLPVIEGHRRGAKALRTICRTARDAGVKILTVYAFSNENWSREKLEVSLLLELCRVFARGELVALREENVQVRILGRTGTLPSATQSALHDLTEGTAHCDGLRLNLAINYGARGEMCDAMRSIAEEVAAGRLKPEQIDEKVIASYLYTGGIPDPELLIRTGGELRVSNFLLYQIAYTELFSTQTCWPEFGPQDFHEALRAYSHRTRRFGT
jgi:undecaprenyl diphosphate synthase